MAALQKRASSAEQATQECERKLQDERDAHKASKDEANKVIEERNKAVHNAEKNAASEKAKRESVEEQL